MSRPLRDVSSRCFEGVIPSVLATCSADGVPNATWLSQVFFVDDRHVALSCQFFRKTRSNLSANPAAQIFVVDPRTGAQWQLDVRFARSEVSGPVFDAMAARLSVIAQMSGMAHVFALQSADVFEVLSVSRVTVEADEAPLTQASPPDTLEGLARLAESIAACGELGALVESGLGMLASHLGYESVCLYLLEESESVLYALSSRGFSRSGVGARIALGVGVVGACAQLRMPIRIADTSREIRYRRVLEEQVGRARSVAEREIALPGLEGAMSLLAVPLLLEGKVFGVLTCESRRRLAFDERDARTLTVAGQMLAQGVALFGDEGEREVGAHDLPPPSSPGTTRVRYYEADDSVFVDGEYVIKGLPGRILWLVLTLRQAEGRSSFSNRELRLHPFLKLPSYKDNLETRLLMLQRRLDERQLPLRLHREQRGRLRISCEAAVELERVAP